MSRLFEWERGCGFVFYLLLSYALVAGLAATIILLIRWLFF